MERNSPEGSLKRRSGVIREFLLMLLRLYQRFFSPWLGGECRFYPTCSEYARLSLEYLPYWKAIPKILWRLLRCHPYHPGGVDLPFPEAESLLLKDDTDS